MLWPMGPHSVQSHSAYHLVRDCVKSLNTPNFSWGLFNFGLRRSAGLLPRLLLFPLASRAKRDIKTNGDLLLRRRLTLKIPQLKLGVLREFRTVS